MSHHQYTHISQEERVIIENRLKNSESYRCIALALGRDVATISREVRRNSTPSTNRTTRVNLGALSQLDSRHYRGQTMVVRIRESKQRYHARIHQFHAGHARYAAKQAQISANQKQSGAKRVVPKLNRAAYEATRQYIREKLLLRWSPEQIQLRCIIEGLP